MYEGKKMKTVILEIDELYDSAAQKIVNTLKRRPDAVIALAGGKTMSPLFAKLSKLCNDGAVSFRDAKILAVAEFVEAEESIRIGAQLQNELISNIDIHPENFHTPEKFSPDEYDELIRTLGGLDIAVLGIGYNGHIAYNEPATPFDSHTHVQKLTDKTKALLSKRGIADEQMPQYAITMGIKTLTDARDIAVIAVGEDKAAAVFQMLYAKTTSYIPAAFLQLPLNVTVYCDRDAASRL